MSPPILLFLLDAERVGSTMFLKDLTERLTGLGPAGPARICLHGSGPQTEQVLEGAGLFPDRTDGVVAVSSDRERELVDRSIREINQRLVALFTHQQVAAVSAHGSDRGLFERTGEDELRVGPTGWITDLARKGVTPVVSSVARTGGRTSGREIGLARTASAFVGSAEEDLRVVVFTEESGYGVRRNGTWQDRVVLAEVDEDEIRPVYALTRRLVEAGLPVWVTSPRGVAAEGGMRATRIEEAG